VILPELVDGRWWGYLMHANRERRLRKRLLRHGGSAVVVASVPWQLQPPDPAQAIMEEEPHLAKKRDFRLQSSHTGSTANCRLSRNQFLFM
jgi:hypothetical protein